MPFLVQGGVTPDDSVSTVKVQDDAITLAKMAGGTDGNIISFDTSGNPVAVASGSDGQVLTSSGADTVCAFEDAAGGGILIQSVQTTDTTNRSTTSTSYVTTSISAVLGSDLKDTGSRVRVRVTMNAGHADSSRARFTLHNGTATLHDAAVDSMAELSLSSSSSDAIKTMENIAFEFFHTPGTVTPLTYTLQWLTSGATVYLGRRGNDTLIDTVSATISVEELD